MATISKASAVTILTRLGFRVNTSARYTQGLKDFQRGWYLGTALVVDGLLGPKTSAALLASEKNRAAGKGTMSAHFSFSEFVCKCGGKYAACRRVWTPRSVVLKMEQSRSKVGRPISVISGCRCVGHNAAVGGVKDSQHLQGLAVDWQGPDKDTVRSWRYWTGIGYGSRSDTAQHTDLRTNRTTTNPALWPYNNR